MTNKIRYGDRELDMGDLTLELTKQLMARHFPELADPKIDRKETKNGDVVYTFTKKAGRKGARQCRPYPAAEPHPGAADRSETAADHRRPETVDG